MDNGGDMEIRNIYNDEEEIKKYVRDLKTLHEIIHARHEAAYTFGIRLKPLKLLNGYLWMDTCGNTMQQSEDRKDTYCTGRIPTEKDICPYCGEGWTLNNIKNHFGNYDYEKEKMIFHHNDCYRMKIQEIQRQEFTDIFQQIYNLEDLKFKPIPNCYDRNYIGFAPWFIVSTPDGEIKIGWRKRVINISWLDTYKPFTEIFENEDVTRGFDKYQDKERFVHAWSVDKCVEYLKRAKESIV